MEPKIVFSAIALLCLTTVAVNALKCYECTGTNDGPCFDPEAQNVTSVECEVKSGPGDYVCYKVIYTNANDNDIVKRGCEKESNFDALCNLVTGVENLECLRCDDDLCNASEKIGAVSFAFLAFCLLLAKLF